MTESQPQAECSSGLRPIGSAFGRLIVGMNALGSLWILALVLLVSSDAIGRSFFAHPIAGVTELIQISIVGIVFLQLADAVRNGKLTRADTFLGFMGARFPRGAHAVEAAFFLLGAAYMALALWGTVPLLVEAIERKSYLGNEGVFTVIVWPVKAITALGLAVCLVEFLRQMTRALQRAMRG